VELSRFDNILAMKTEAGEVIGFHSHNMQVARLTESLWTAMTSAETSSDPLALAELSEWNVESDAAATDSVIKSEVRSLMVNIAQICNLQCTYCAAGGDGTFGEPLRHVDIETIYSQLRMFLHDVPNGGQFSITFFGGEPLINPAAIRQLARFAKLQVIGRDIDLRFCTITNGTLVTKDIAELLASIGCHVTISLDGPPEINNKFRQSRGGRGTTERVLKGLEELKKIRHRLGSLSVGAVFGKHNTRVLESYRFLRAFNFDSLKFDFAADQSDEAASAAFADELAQTADEAFKMGGEAELRKIAQFDSYFQALDQQRRLNNHCGAGKSMLTIDGRGKLTSCQWFVGNLDENLGQGTDLDHQRISSFAKPLNEMNNCQACWARNLCGGGCMFVNDLKNGSKHKKDQAFCQRTRLTIAKAIEYYAQSRSTTIAQGAQNEEH